MVLRFPALFIHLSAHDKALDGWINIPVVMVFKVMQHVRMCPFLAPPIPIAGLFGLPKHDKKHLYRYGGVETRENLR
jgi:hypothetical protein